MNTAWLKRPLPQWIVSAAGSIAMGRPPTIIRASSRVSSGETAKALYYRKPLLGTHGGRSHDVLRGLCALGAPVFSGNGSASPLPTPITPWVLRFSQEFMERISTISAQSTSSMSCRRLAAMVMRTIAGDIRLTGRRGPAR